jgi:hypothetical protein
VKLFPFLFAVGLALWVIEVHAATVYWKSAEGEWKDAAQWGGALPGGRDIAEVEGNSHVRLGAAEVMASQLDVGAYHGGVAEMEMSEGALSLSKLLRIGEAPGSGGRFWQRGGEINALEICLGGANTGKPSEMPTTAEMEVSGGEIFTRHFTLGWAMGAKTTLRIVGSKAAPIAVLDYFWVGIRQPEMQPSEIAMEYVIDGDGVTPIVVWNKKSSVVALVDEACRSTCRLRVALKAAPPAGEIALLQLPKPCRGVFTDLPSGGAVRAEFGGRTYEWRINYAGGPAKTDVVLEDPHVIGANGERVPYTAAPLAKRRELSAAALEAAMRRRIARQEKEEPPMEASGPLAFPGATGFGAYAKGGRGGKVIAVTSLEDAGPGSLREALAAKGPRTVVFRVAGMLRLKSGLVIREPFVTVAGQTAPGDGIGLALDSSAHADTLVLNQTHDVVLRYLRMFSGKGPGPSKPDDGGDCISVYDSENFILDHCSTHFGTDETLSVTGASDRYTVQWCVIAEGLNYERHSMSSLLGGGRCTWSHNLFAHSGSRNPHFAGEPRCDFRNNVLYDWGITSGQGSFAQLNYAGNYLKPGPSTRQKPPLFLSAEATALPGSLYLAGNIMDAAPEVTRDNWLGTRHDRICGSTAPPPFAAAPVEEAATAYERVLAQAGASFPARDAADARVVADVRQGTGKIVETQEEAGGWPELRAATSEIIDTDGDGLPDEWERRHGLDSGNAADAQKETKGGCTWLERYLNELVEMKER